MLPHGFRSGSWWLAGVLSALALLSAAAQADDPQQDSKTPPVPETNAPPAPEEQPGPIPVTPAPTEAEARIYEALGQPIDLQLIELPLEDVVAQLRDERMIPIVIDRKALTESNARPDEPVTLNVQGISLRSALQLMLAEVGLSYAVHNEVLLVTSEKAAAALTEIRVYDVADILTAGSSTDDLARVLTEALQTEPPPATYNVFVTPEEELAAIESRKTAAARQSITAYQRMLIVRDTTIGHQRLLDTLNGIRAGVLHQRKLDELLAEQQRRFIEEMERQNQQYEQQGQPPQQPQDGGAPPQPEPSQDRQS